MFSNEDHISDGLHVLITLKQVKDHKSIHGSYVVGSAKKRQRCQINLTHNKTILSENKPKNYFCWKIFYKKFFQKPATSIFIHFCYHNFHYVTQWILNQWHDIIDSSYFSQLVRKLKNSTKNFFLSIVHNSFATVNL